MSEVSGRTTAPQLAAGGIDIVTAADPYGCSDIMICQDLLEDQECICGWRPEAVVDSVHGDEVHLEGASGDQRRQGGRFVRMVIPAVDDHIGHRHRPSDPASVHLSQIEGFRQRGPSRNGHQSLPLVGIGRVDRNGQADRKTQVQERTQALGMTRCGDRDPPRRHSQAVGVGQDLQGSRHLVDVVQGFAHAHEDNVEGAIAEFLDGVGHQIQSEQLDLFDDFPAAQLPHEAAAGRGAKRTGHRTSHLARHAEGGVLLHGDHDAFDRLAVPEFEEVFPGSILRALAFLEGQAAGIKAFGETRKQGSGQVGHGAPVHCMMAVHPLRELFGPIARLSHPANDISQVVRGQAVKKGRQFDVHGPPQPDDLDRCSAHQHPER